MATKAKRGPEKRPRGAVEPVDKVDTSKGFWLNPKQTMFVQYLLEDPQFNIGAAAKRAGYKSKADTTRLMENPLIRSSLGRKINERIAKSDLSAERVLKELACVGFFNVQDVLDARGQVKNIVDMPRDAAACIKEIKVSYKEEEGTNGEVTEIRNMEIKFWDKMQALENMAKHLGLFKEVMTLNANVQINWDSLVSGQRPSLERVDPVETQIEQMKQLSSQVGTEMGHLNGAPHETVIEGVAREVKQEPPLRFDSENIVGEGEEGIED